MGEPALAIDQDKVWKAIADPARRQILDLLRGDPQRTADLSDALAAGFGISRFMVMKHLKLLVEAGLVLVVRKGRERWNHLNAVPIQAIHRRWIEPFAQAPADGLLRLKQLVESSTPESESPEMSEAKPFECHEVVVEVEVNAPREKVWRTLTEETTKWFPNDYRVKADSTFRLQAKIGGLMFEDHGDGEGTVWGTVNHVKKLESIRLSAELWPEYGGPGRSIQRFELSDVEGGTKLRFSDTMWGPISAKTAASMNGGWSYLFQKAFKNYAETGELPPAKSEVDSDGCS